MVSPWTEYGRCGSSLLFPSDYYLALAHGPLTPSTVFSATEWLSQSTQVREMTPPPPSQSFLKIHVLVLGLPVRPRVTSAVPSAAKLSLPFCLCVGFHHLGPELASSRPQGTFLGEPILHPHLLSHSPVSLS